MSNQDKSSIHPKGSLSNEDLALADLLNNQLNLEAENLDEVMRARLSAARHQALELETAGKWRKLSSDAWKRSFVPIALSVTLALIWFGTTVETPQPSYTVEESVLFNDLPILAADDAVEFYQSIDFLIWLQNEATTNGDNGVSGRRGGSQPDLCRFRAESSRPCLIGISRSIIGA